jgi:predicted component of type VI protein secretion system
VLRLGFGELRFELTQAGGEFLIGRSDSCDLVVGAPRISRFHARIEHRDGRFLLLDESRNGTWVRFADGTQQRVGSIPVSLEGRGQIALTGPPGDANPHVIEFEV